MTAFSSTILYVVNTPDFFLSHRLPIAEAARKAGYRVVIATASGNAVKKIANAGFEHYAIEFSRSGVNLLRELMVCYSLFKLFKKIKPDIVHLVTIKPVLYGGAIARLTKIPGVIAAISGLGFIFSSAGLKAALLRYIVIFWYRFVLRRKNLKVIFQNKDDRDILRNANAVSEFQIEMIRGSGVDLNLYADLPEPQNTPVISFAARLLRDKGVVEFVEAARLLSAQKIEAIFWLIGDIDPGNPNTITATELGTWQDEGVIKIFGYRSDIPALFEKSNIIVLPSYYGEGLPKVLIEAAACGRAVITTDHPGCRDAIEANKTGLLVPIRNVHALANAIKLLIKDPKLRKQLGQAGRQLAEREFSIEKVIAAHIDIYKKLSVII